MKTRIVALAALVSLAPGAHAVSLQFVGADVSGGRTVAVLAGSDSASFGSNLVPTVGATRVEASGMAAGNVAPLNGGVVSYGASDAVNATLTASPSGMVFSASAFSFLGLTGVGQLQQTTELSSLDLRTELRILSGTDPVGTAVSLRLAGSGFSTFSAPGITADDLSIFDIRVIAADGTLLAAHHGSSADQAFDVAFVAAVGDEMEFQLRHDRGTSFLGDLDISSGTRHMVSVTALEGSITVTAVPEPGTWALLLSGLGLIPLLSRARRA